MNNMMGVSVEMARMAKMSFCRWARERKTAREEAEKGGTFIPSTEVSNICHRIALAFKYIICQLELHNLLLYCSCSFITLHFR